MYETLMLIGCIIAYSYGTYKIEMWEYNKKLEKKQHHKDIRDVEALIKRIHARVGAYKEVKGESK